MKKEELIKQLQALPDGVEVVIFDHRKNLDQDSGDGSSAGIYKDFQISHHTPEEIADGCIPFASMAFDNEDYEG